MKVNTRALQTHPLLSLLPGSVLKTFLKDPSFLEYPKGTVVYNEGEPCDAIYIIISGRCESRHLIGENGHGEVESVYGPGDTLGERELLNAESYRSTVVVITQCVLLKISGDLLEKLFQDNPTVAGKFSRTVVDRIRLIQENRRERYSSSKRITSILSLSPQLEMQTICRKLAANLFDVARQSVLMVHFVPYKERVELKDIAVIDPSNGHRFYFADALRRGDNGYDEMSVYVSGAPGEPAYIAPFLSHLGSHYDYVVLHLSSEVPVPTTIEAMIQSDLAYLFLQASAANIYELRLLMRELGTQTVGKLVHIKPVLCINERIMVAGVNQSLMEMGHPVHAYIRGCPMVNGSGEKNEGLRVNFQKQMRSMAREIARCRVGLALSSGGAKGLAHVGVIQVLEENGIEIDVVAGSSMGAYVAALWTYGYNGQDLEKVAREVEGRWGLMRLLDPVLPPRRGFLRTTKVMGRLRNSIGEARFSDLEIPLRVVATYLNTLERIVFSSGEVAQAVEASIAIPGICVPVEIDGETYIDGGIADPLPVDVLMEMGVEKIIAVNTIPTPERLRYWLERDLETQKKEHRPSIGKLINRHLNYFAKGNVLDIMFRSIHGVQMRVADAAGRDADVLLRPLSYEAKWHDFANPGRYIALGRKIAESQISELKSLVRTEANEKKSKRVAEAA